MNRLAYFCSGELTWEPRSSFVDADDTENDIFADYNQAHPIKARKRKLDSSNSSQKAKKPKQVPNTQ